MTGVTAIAAYTAFLRLAPDDPNVSIVRQQLKQLTDGAPRRISRARAADRVQAQTATRRACPRAGRLRFGATACSDDSKDDDRPPTVAEARNATEEDPNDPQARRDLSTALQTTVPRPMPSQRSPATPSSRPKDSDGPAGALYLAQAGELRKAPAGARRAKASFRKAAATYRRIVALEPKLPSVRLELGQAAEQAGDTAAAIAAYRSFLRLAPKDPNAPVVRRHINQLMKQIAAGGLLGLARSASAENRNPMAALAAGVLVAALAAAASATRRARPTRPAARRCSSRSAGNATPRRRRNERRDRPESRRCVPAGPHRRDDREHCAPGCTRPDPVSGIEVTSTGVPGMPGIDQTLPECSGNARKGCVEDQDEAADDVAAYVASVAGVVEEKPGGAAGSRWNDGKTIFASAGCGTCHTSLTRARVERSARNLDTAEPPHALVVERVTNGRGAMPPSVGSSRQPRSRLWRSTSPARPGADDEGDAEGRPYGLVGAGLDPPYSGCA